MLALETVMEVRRLLVEGHLSHRKIALQLGVSRGIVNSIASGRRGLHGRETTTNYSYDSPELVAQRCRGCGAMVYMPCLLCRARQYRVRQQRDEPQHSCHRAIHKPRVA
ncbi:hypothetical protein [Bythopirellula polymerisocia]|uniref:Transposase IS30-like HTH domain-containing protein n=1 Tax=Bythopirellula polymerisocia TaxID=2528003 RepID=A0A5C6CEJ4_9BACT|nr:hypothetical protein [Bythopirellula polymerisocia]TWU22688.1 hypothetical protein Pla144_41480 [Bythopirellula polymerisocia]